MLSTVALCQKSGLQVMLVGSGEMSVLSGTSPLSLSLTCGKSTVQCEGSPLNKAFKSEEVLSAQVNVTVVGVAVHA